MKFHVIFNWLPTSEEYDEYDRYIKSGEKPSHSSIGNKKKMREEYLQSLLPKTEWDVEIDEQGKIKLI